MAKKKEELDIMALAASVQAGGEVDEEALAAEKTFTFILKGKRMFDIRAKDEETAMAIFKEDELFGNEKIIDVIEKDESENSQAEQKHFMAQDRGHTKKEVIDVNQFELAAKVAEERKTRTITKMVMNADGTSSEVTEKAPAKKTRAKKKS